MRVFFDSNVIIDALSGREKSTKVEETLLYGAVVGSLQGIISAKQLTDIYYVLRRYYSSDERRRELLAILVAGFEIAPVDCDVCSKALDSSIPDYEDAVIAECADRYAADYILTNDVKGFVKSKIPPIKPMDIAKLLRL